MALIAWKESFKCGHPSVDYEHENLISLINEMHEKIADDCPAEVIGHYLGEIHALIEAHFALEEKIMRDNGYQGYAPHKEDHDNLLEEILDIMEGAQEEAAASQKEALAEKMNRWFGVHFSTFDKDFHNTGPG